MKYWQKCPICDGVGQVSGGYYARAGDYPYGLSSDITEMCQTCKGECIIETPEQEEADSKENVMSDEVKELIEQVKLTPEEIGEIVGDCKQWFEIPDKIVKAQIQKLLSLPLALIKEGELPEPHWGTFMPVKSPIQGYKKAQQDMLKWHKKSITYLKDFISV